MGMIMEPQAGDPNEVEGVFHPEPERHDARGASACLGGQRGCGANGNECTVSAT
jgi:hypothetical protein